jgi:phage recombination protein Bet
MNKPEQSTAMAKTEDRHREWIPIGETEPIKMSAGLVKKYFATPTKNGYKPSDEMVMEFLMIMAARKLNPWVGDAWIIGYDSKEGPQFSIVTAYQALAKRAEMHPEYDGIEWGVIVEVDGKYREVEGAFHGPDEKLVGAWAKVYRKDRGRPFVAKVQRAPYDKGYSQWKVNPAWMIAKVARAAAMREAFPLELGGLYTEEDLASKFRNGHGEVIDAQTVEKPKVTIDDLTKPAAPERQDNKLLAELQLDLRRTVTFDDVARVRESYSTRTADQDVYDSIVLACEKRMREIEDMRQQELFDAENASLASNDAAADV